MHKFTLRAVYQDRGDGSQASLARASIEAMWTNESTKKGKFSSLFALMHLHKRF